MSAGSSAQPHILRGTLMIMTAVAMFVAMDSMAKYLSRFYPVPAIVWARYFFHLLLVLVALGPRLGVHLARTRRLIRTGQAAGPGDNAALSRGSVSGNPCKQRLCLR